MKNFLIVIYYLFTCNLLLCEEQSILIDQKYRQFLKSYCVDCHNANKQKGDVRLDTKGFSFEIITPKQADQWQHILAAINAKEMPPEKKKQPSSQEKSDFLEMLSAKLVEARVMLSDSSGKITMRRLNRREYKNTMESFLGVAVNVSDLPDDHSSETFDTNGSSLFISPDQIEKYLSIARSAISRALKKEDLEQPVKIRVQPEISANRRITKRHKDYLDGFNKAIAYETSKENGSSKSYKEFGLVDEKEAYFYKTHYNRFFAIYDHYLKNPLSKTGIITSLWHPIYDPTFKIDALEKLVKIKRKDGSEIERKIRQKLPEGLYKIRSRVGRLPNAQPERYFLDFGVTDGKFSHLKTFHITAPIEKPQIIEETVLIGPDNRSITFREKSAGENARSMYERGKKENGVGPTPSLWIDWFEYEGPLPPKQPAQLQEILNDAKEGNLTDTKLSKIFYQLCRTVFRKNQIDNSYIQRLIDLYHQEIRIGKREQDAVVEPLAVILSSPRFLFLTEPVKENQKRKLTQEELSTKLAYLLWSSPPDKPLKNLVTSGKLYNNQLRIQVDRMLNDHRSMNFIRSFAYQWLDIERLHLFKFSPRLYFDNTIKKAASEEVYHTIKYIIDHNLSTKNFLKSDFVVINSLMANHYGIKGIKGHEYRRVNLPKNSVRGGLTGMAAVLAMGSDGKESSPIERGAWVLRKILNSPPPPAPANVPQLSRLHDKPLSAREILKIHQEEPQCAHCHSKIDPIGVGLENFDPTGLWRTDIDVGRGNRKRTQEIDPSGKLYRGPEFKNYLELRDYFHTRVDDFNRGLIKSLLSYCLNREVGFTDQDLIDDLAKGMKNFNHSLRWLIHTIVQHESFQTKK